ncbi:MAG: gfo/Idh/MocA family oxidoreductase [Candidatus Latescibacteria bacterium]|nr:gfo/Idh/MocA family oxidoreductase [Candidatus Latescibacterota bacterium]
MSFKLAFAGFRHGHILELYKLAQQGEGVEIVAACEEDETARESLAAGIVDITHAEYGRMLDQVDCDAVAIGDYYAKRGQLAVEALQQGKHVIADKPLCTELDEVDQIEALADSTGLKVGCMLTMRDSRPIIGLRQVVQEGEIGAVHALSFGGQHPLMLGQRPGWYFEPGKHGGTINDIGVHAIDALPWITGLDFAVVNAARCWNAFAPEFPHFKDGGQMMLTMDNGCGVLGDVSYFAPDKAGYSMPYYWRITLWGRNGVAETSTTATAITVLGAGEQTARSVPLPPADKGGYWRAFLDDIAGRPTPQALDTQQVLDSARTVLTIQRAADKGEREVALS